MKINLNLIHQFTCNLHLVSHATVKTARCTGTWKILYLNSVSMLHKIKNGVM